MTEPLLRVSSEKISHYPLFLPITPFALGQKVQRFSTKNNKATHIYLKSGFIFYLLRALKWIFQEHYFRKLSNYLELFDYISSDRFLSFLLSSFYGLVYCKNDVIFCNWQDNNVIPQVSTHFYITYPVANYIIIYLINRSLLMYIPPLWLNSTALWCGEEGFDSSLSQHWSSAYYFGSAGW